MKKLGLLGTSALRSVAFVGFTAVLAGPAFAQDADQDPPETLQSEVEIESGQNIEEGGDQTITVTGSRIRRPNLESTVPITSIAGESFFEQGNSNVGDTLNELPQLRSTRGQSNPSLGIGIAGLNLLDLRGLGQNRTLVLVNGRRHVAADFTSTGSAVDINTIPNDLIERVDIVTGGNSAIYGSDAIAGVVNFVLRRDFEGVQIRGNAGLAIPEGWGSNQYVSAMVGTNFAGGRGNVTLHAEYAHQERVFASDIPHLRSVEGLGVVDTDPAGTPNGSDGNPDRVYFRDIRQRNTSRFGTVFVSQNTAGPGCGLGVGGNPYNCLLVFDAAGNLRPSDETGRFAAGPIGGAIGGTLLETGREDILAPILPSQDRYNVNLLARFEVADWAEAFVEAKYVRIDTQGSGLSTGGIQGNFTQFDVRERLRLDNPFLTTAQQNQIAAALLTSGCRPNVSSVCNTNSPTSISGPLTAADITAINNRTFRFALGRSDIAGTVRDELFRRETYRVVGGLRGTFNGDWNYEIAANYGRTEENTQTFGYVDKQRLMLSLDAGRDPVTGQIRCRSQFDPAAALAFDAGAFQAGGTARTNAGQLARLQADIAACVPFNPFGGTADNSAARSYFNVNTSNEAWTDQLVLSGFVSGDTSGFFNLWGGPIRFALGGEYRRQDIFFQQDDFASAGNTNNVVLGTFYDPPEPFEVKEAFAEIQIPIIANQPFFEELTVSGAARVADYKLAAGTVWAYNVGLDWAPVQDIRFRGNFSRAVRAPYLTELGGSAVQNFSPGFVDPCSPNQIGTGTATRAANCQADLGALLPNLVNRTYSLGVVNTPNANLAAESSDSWTVGAVFQPRFVPGLVLSVDYYDITVNGIIASPTAQQIVNSCYDQPTLQNQFCALFSRFRGPGTGPNSETAGDIQYYTLQQQPLNYASLVRRGIDFQLTYRTELTDDVRLNFNAIYTHNLQIDNFLDPARPTFANRVLSELGDPEDEFRIDTDIQIGSFTLGHRLRYIGSMVVGNWENYNSINGLPPADADFADITEYPEVFYNDLRFEWDVTGNDGDGNYGRDLNFYVGIDNIFNTKPPLGATGSGAGGGGGSNDNPGSANSTGAIYEVRGRQAYAGFRFRF